MIGYTPKRKRSAPPGRITRNSTTGYRKPLPPFPPKANDVLSAITPKTFTVQDLLARGSIQRDVEERLGLVFQKKLKGMVKVEGKELEELCTSLAQLAVMDLVKAGPRLSDFPRRRGKCEESGVVELSDMESEDD